MDYHYYGGQSELTFKGMQKSFNFARISYFSSRIWKLSYLIDDFFKGCCCVWIGNWSRNGGDWPSSPLWLPSSSCPHPLHTSSGIQLQGGLSWKITALKPAKLCKMCQGNHPKACRVSLDVFTFFEYLNPEIEWVICRIYNTSHTRFEVQVGRQAECFAGRTCRTDPAMGGHLHLQVIHLNTLN